jgi:hypothetical protein
MSDNFENFEDGVFIEDRDGIITVHNIENASIRAQMEKLQKNVYSYYQNIKAALLSNGKVQNRTYLGKECFYIKEDTVAKFNIVDGKLYFYVKLAPSDTGSVGSFKRPNHNVDQDRVLTLVVVNGDKDEKKALQLVNLLMQKYNFNQQ